MCIYIFFFSEVNDVQYKLMLQCLGDLRQTFSCLNRTSFCHARVQSKNVWVLAHPMLFLVKL